MSFVLDTDICSAFMKGNRSVWQKFKQHEGQLSVCTITVGELFTWAFRAGSSPKRLITLREFLKDVTAIEVTATIAEKFGELRAKRLDSGQITSDMDLFIAATALIHDFTLVTHNIRDYVGVDGLRIQDWLT